MTNNSRSMVLMDFGVVCRTCMSCKTDLKSIFNSDLAEMLNSCQFIQVSPKDGLPHNICTKCRDILVQSYHFKIQCEKSNSIFKKYLELENSLAVSALNNVGTKDQCFVDDDTTGKIFLKNHTSETEKFDCLKCNKIFSNLHTFKNHKKVLEKQNECKYSSLLEKLLDVTQPELKSGDNDKTDSADDLTAFLDVEPPPPLPFSCTECSQSFNAEYDLKLHKSTHTKTGVYICTSCKKHFATRQMLKRHIKTHMLHKPHVCQKCGKGFAESHALTKHLRKHTGQPREKKHLCPVCGQGFSEPFYLNVHMRKHTGERPLICSACGKSFADPRSLKAHNMTHTGERPYKCHLCSKAFSQSVNLTKHIRVHTGEKPYVCTKCGKCFSQSSSLDKHSRTHTGERPYACEQCPKRFAEKGTLIHHNRTHTGEKPYVCAQCGRSFASSSELKLHDRKHSGIKKNVCEQCGKDFATPSNLVVHSRTHSGEKPYSCLVCNKAFTDRGSLKKHSKIHDDKRSIFQNSSVTGSFVTNVTQQNMNVIHNVIERTLDFGLNERLYYNLN